MHVLESCLFGFGLLQIYSTSSLARDMNCQVFSETLGALFNLNIVH